MHGIANTFDLLIQTADISERDIRHFLKHQVGIILRGNQRKRESHGRIDRNTVGHIDRSFRQRSRTADQRNVSTAIRDQQSPIINDLLHRAHCAHSIGAGLRNHHHVLVEQHRAPSLKPGCLHIRRNRHDHATASGNHLGAGMLYPLFVRARGMHANHGGEGHGRSRQLVQLGLGLGELLGGTAQRLGQRMILGHQLVVGLTQRRQRLITLIHCISLAFHRMRFEPFRHFVMSWRIRIQHAQPLRIPIVLMISDNQNHA